MRHVEPEDLLVHVPELHGLWLEMWGSGRALLSHLHLPTPTDGELKLPPLCYSLAPLPGSKAAIR